MKYINQLQLRHVAYETNVLHGGRPPELRNIASNGCGICATCMMVELLTDKELPVEECVQISYDTVANHKPGTDLDRLSPAVAERFDLDYEPTDDLDEVIDALRCGVRRDCCRRHRAYNNNEKKKEIRLQKGMIQ